MASENANPPDRSESDARRQDLESVERFLNGDEQGIRDLLDRYDRLVRFSIFKTGRRYCQKDPDWLNARANEAWSRIVERLRWRESPSNFPAYFSQISRNTCLDAIARADRREAFRIAEYGSDGNPIDADDEADPAAVIEHLDQLDAIRSVIPSLSQADRQILDEVGLIVDRKWREAADRLGMAESTLRSRWEGILARLRTGLSEKKSKSFAPQNRSTDP